ncbi:MAG: sulfotransferase family protein [Elusimicrobiota bacterium]
MKNKKDKDGFKIDFIGIGAPRCATTWIFECLKEHPEICGSSKKEIHFFDKPHRFRKGKGYYASFFEHCSDRKLWGEYTPSYLHYKKAPSRMYNYFPDAKLLVSLRNPVERAYSHYRRGKINKSRLGHYDNFREAVERDPVVVEKGFYFKQLKRYYKYFPQENILIQFYKDLKKNPKNFIQNIYDFLGVESVDFTPSSLNSKQGTTGGKLYDYKLPLFNDILWSVWNRITPPDRYGVLPRFLKKAGVRDLGKFILKWNKKCKNKVENKPSKVDNIDQSTRRYLYGVYSDDIVKLENFINKDLSHWKQDGRR